MPKRIRLSRKKGSKLPPKTVNVARPSRFGNPFNWKDSLPIYSENESKQHAVIDFERWLDGYWSFDPKSIYPGLYENKRQWILDNLHLIAEADYIACWCKPDEQCHADVLLEIANE